MGNAGILAGWLCVDWPVTGVNIAEIVNRYACDRDLVIVGQTDYNYAERGISADLPEHLIRNSGRPVLVVPYAGVFKPVGERVMVAWKQGRESVRALNDAMPLLLDADQVTLLAINSLSVGENCETGHDQSICVHLSRHGIKAKLEQFVSGDIPIGDVLHTQAWESGYDMLVMGSFAHNQRGMLTLSPVATHVLKHMTMPVLMSH